MAEINKFILNDQFHAKIFNKIKERMFADKQPVRASIAVFIGGQPGSGKSSLTEKAPDKFTHNVVIIDPDNLRQHHPDYENLLKQDSRTAASLLASWRKTG